MLTAMNSAPQTNDVMVLTNANQKTKRWASKGSSHRLMSAGPSTDTQMT